MISNSYIVRTLDGNGDWTFGAGLNDYAANNAAVAQDIEMALNMLLGNCFFATNVGLPWWSLLGGKSLLAISLALNAALLSVTGVTGILSAVPTLSSNRRLVLTYRVQTQYGELQSTFVYDTGLATQGGTVGTETGT